MKYEHTPVMLGEVLAYLNPQPGQYFIDCTLGGGGYTIEIAKKVGHKGRVLSIDLDELAIENAKLLISPQPSKLSAGQANFQLHNIILIHDNFKNLSFVIKKHLYNSQNSVINGIVFDLGLSQAQLQDRSRGFSFQLDGPLDMRFAHTRIATNKNTNSHEKVQIATNNNAEYIVNNWKSEDLEKIFREYGEERFAKRIARAIVRARKSSLIKTTKHLVEIIKKAVPKKYLHSKIHPATRTFQALRIATNNELENLEKTLPQAVDLLKRRGKIAIISYHSLEDRIVKNFLKKESKNCICPPELPKCCCQHKAKLKIITKKVKMPTAEEIKRNPQARSAKLRVAEKL